MRSCVCVCCVSVYLRACARSCTLKAVVYLQGCRWTSSWFGRAPSCPTCSTPTSISDFRCFRRKWTSSDSRGRPRTIWSVPLPGVTSACGWSVRAEIDHELTTSIQYQRLVETVNVGIGSFLGHSSCVGGAFINDPFCGETSCRLRCVWRGKYATFGGTNFPILEFPLVAQPTDENQTKINPKSK